MTTWGGLARAKAGLGLARMKMGLRLARGDGGVGAGEGEGGFAVKEGEGAKAGWGGGSVRCSRLDAFPAYGRVFRAGFPRSAVFNLVVVGGLRDH